VDATSSQPDDLLLTVPELRDATGAPHPRIMELGLSTDEVQELCFTADIDSCGLTRDEFGAVLADVGAKLSLGLPPGTYADAAQSAAFFRSLRLTDLALAHACALGREVAWQRFLSLYRNPLTQAAITITGSATLGHDLADSLYSELYGLREVDGERRSPLASYSGRGSLLGWLRTTLAQRHIDHHRRTRRETPLDELDAPAAPASAVPAPAELAQLHQALTRTLQALPAEDRFLLSSYFLDRQTLLQIARTIHVHEATISRRLKRLVAHLHKGLLDNLKSGGLSKRAAEEALGADPRDIEINLRSLLQISQTTPFLDKTAAEVIAESDPS
jgi:RNA polymerase sigma-70 factor (ECF subfamily)